MCRTDNYSTQLSGSREDYLKTIYMLTGGKGGARLSDIARNLGVKYPSVSKAVDRLGDDGFVHNEPWGEIYLTQTGLEIARRVYEKHTVLMKWLMSIGVSETQADIEACRIEHALSDETFKLLKKAVE